MEELKQRIEMLKEYEILNEKSYQDILGIVTLFQEKYSIVLTEENAGVMITHMSAAFRRNETNEKIEPLDEFTKEELTKEQHYDKAFAIIQDIKDKIQNELSNDEEPFFLIHIVNLLSQI